MNTENPTQKEHVGGMQQSRGELHDARNKYMTEKNECESVNQIKYHTKSSKHGGESVQVQLRFPCR